MGMECEELLHELNLHSQDPGQKALHRPRILPPGIPAGVGSYHTLVAMSCQLLRLHLLPAPRDLVEPRPGTRAREEEMKEQCLFDLDAESRRLWGYWDEIR